MWGTGSQAAGNSGQGEAGITGDGIPGILRRQRRSPVEKRVIRTGDPEGRALSPPLRATAASEKAEVQGILSSPPPISL